MRYVREVSGYLVVALVTFPLVSHLWLQYRLREILATGSGVTLREYVAPSWHRLAARVRSGEVTLTTQEQAARLERMAAFFESEARAEQRHAATDVDEARMLFRASLAVFLLQIVVAVAFGISSLRNRRAVVNVPPNSA